MSRTISMKVKAALAGATFLAGVGFAGSAMASVTVNDGVTEGPDSDLFLILFDTSKTTTYVEDLGVQTSAVATDSAINSAASAATPGHLSTALPGYSAVYDPTTALANYLSTNSGDTFEWAVMADSSSPSNSVANFFTISSAPLNSVSATFTSTTNGGASNTNLSTNVNSLGNDIDNWIGDVGFTANGVHAYSSDTASGGNEFVTSAYLPGQGGDTSIFDWYSNGTLTAGNSFKPSSGTSTASFYLASVSTQAGGVDDIFNLGTVSLSAAGVLTFAPLSAVPLPGALWLLGSGLLGLAGVSRRRTA